MPTNYTYTHGATTNLNRLRFLLGDHRGTSGAWTGTDQVWSDEELTDLLTIAGDSLPVAARLAIQNRICREAMASGVSGTTDTTDRPRQLALAQDTLAQLNYPLAGQEHLPKLQVTANADLADHDDLGG